MSVRFSVLENCLSDPGGESIIEGPALDYVESTQFHDATGAFRSNIRSHPGVSLLE